MLLPVTPLGGLLGFEPLPPIFWAVLVGILVAYVGAAELAKLLFYGKVKNGAKGRRKAFVNSYDLRPCASIISLTVRAVVVQPKKHVHPAVSHLSIHEDAHDRLSPIVRWSFV